MSYLAKNYNRKKIPLNNEKEIKIFKKNEKKKINFFEVKPYKI